MSLSTYSWDEKKHLFCREGAPSFPCSDETSVEQRLFKIVRSASDKSVFSQELYQAATDWPTEYHLGRSRHCLIRPLGIKAGDKVLDLGAGCGAIARYLGEVGAHVTAVEGNVERASIAAERCRDLNSVRVIADDLLKFETAEKFDWVLLIGVLENAPLLSTDSFPVRHFLRKAKAFLAKTGKIAIAIENKLGLKYFNSCSEDHVGGECFGIQDLYTEKTPRTYGKAELTGHIEASGFNVPVFYYPFPDHKNPSVIFSEEAFREPKFNATDVILRSRSHDYAGWPYRVFSEALVFSTLAENGLASEFSNSFLVVAGTDEAKPREPAFLSMSYSVSRRPEFATATKIYKEGDRIRVAKEPLVPSLRRETKTSKGLTIRNSTASTEYQFGRQVFHRFLKGQARAAPVTELVAILEPWLRFLVGKALPNGSPSREMSSLHVSGDYLDCTPFNVLELESGLTPIDDEWKTDADVPLGWIVTRSVLWCFRSGIATTNTLPSVATLVQALSTSIGLTVSEGDVEKWLEFEAEFQSAVNGKVASVSISDLDSLFSGLLPLSGEVKRLNQTLVAREDQISRLQQNESSLQQMIATRDARLAALEETLTGQANALTHVIAERDNALGRVTTLENTLSWRLTKPLRFAKRVVRSKLP